MTERFSMSTGSATEIIGAGGCVVDIGQISKKTKDYLRQRVRQGVYEEFEYLGFPVPKRAFCLAGKTHSCMGMAP